MQLPDAMRASTGRLPSARLAGAQGVVGGFRVEGLSLR